MYISKHVNYLSRSVNRMPGREVVQLWLVISDAKPVVGLFPRLNC